MGYIARLRKGALIFDLDGTGGVGLMDDFEPPSAQMSNNITIGTGSNFYGGGEFISRKAGPISFTFTVRSMATSNALAEQQVDRLANFLAMAGDKRDPVWFEFRPDNNVGFEPLWGQRGAFRRVEVLALDGLYKSGYAALHNARNRAIFAAVTMTVNMPVLGNRQRACFSSVGIMEDWMGAKDGKSRGVIVPDATTNKIINPVFGNTADWDHDWTAAAGLVLTKNIDLEFVLFGNVSAKIVASSTARFTMSPAAGNTNKHSMEVYVKRPDGAAVSAADCACYYGAAIATAYTSVGNGWYKVSSVNFDGIAAATATGLTIVAGTVLYISGMMLIEKAYNEPMCFGDQMGVAWSGAVHDSTSVRGAGLFYLPISNDTFSYGQFTIRLVWKAGRAITGIDKHLLYDDQAHLEFLFTAADKWSLTDDTNTAQSAALSITAGTTYVFHLTASLSGGLNIYLNGANIATSATYTPPHAAASFLYVGNAGGANYIGGTFKGMTIYDRAMSATEITSDYANILPLITADVRVDWMPYHNFPLSTAIYTDNCTDTNQADYVVVGGIPGDVPAETQIKLTPNQSFAKSIWIGNHPSLIT